MGDKDTHSGIDDMPTIKVVNGTIEVVSEGHCKLLISAN
jgi:hypothetical protein